MNVNNLCNLSRVFSKYILCFVGHAFHQLAISRLQSDLQKKGSTGGVVGIMKHEKFFMFDSETFSRENPGICHGDE